MACLGDLLHLAVDVNGRTDEEEDQDGEAEQQQVLDLLVPSLLYLVGLADDRIDLGHLHRAQPGAAKDGVAHTLVEVGMRTVDIAPSEKDLRQPGQGDVFLDGQLDVAHGRTGQEVDLTFLVAKPAVSLRKVVGQESGQADVIRLVRFEGREDGVDRLLVFSSQDHLLRPGQQVGVGICRLMDRGQGVPVGVRLLEIGLFLLGRRAIIRHITIEGAILVVIAGAQCWCREVAHVNAVEYVERFLIHAHETHLLDPVHLYLLDGGEAGMAPQDRLLEVHIDEGGIGLVLLVGLKKTVVDGVACLVGRLGQAGLQLVDLLFLLLGVERLLLQDLVELPQDLVGGRGDRSHGAPCARAPEREHDQDQI